MQTTTESEDVFDMPRPVSPLDVWVGHRRPVEASPPETAQVHPVYHLKCVFHNTCTVVDLVM